MDAPTVLGEWALNGAKAARSDAVWDAKRDQVVRDLGPHCEEMGLSASWRQDDDDDDDGDDDDDDEAPTRDPDQAPDALLTGIPSKTTAPDDDDAAVPAHDDDDDDGAAVDDDPLPTKADGKTDWKAMWDLLEEAEKLARRGAAGGSELRR